MMNIVYFVLLFTGVNSKSIQLIQECPIILDDINRNVAFLQYDNTFQHQLRDMNPVGTALKKLIQTTLSTEILTELYNVEAWRYIVSIKRKSVYTNLANNSEEEINNRMLRKKPPLTQTTPWLEALSPDTVLLGFLQASYKFRGFLHFGVNNRKFLKDLIALESAAFLSFMLEDINEAYEIYSKLDGINKKELASLYPDRARNPDLFAPVKSALELKKDIRLESLGGNAKQKKAINITNKIVQPLPYLPFLASNSQTLLKEFSRLAFGDARFIGSFDDLLIDPAVFFAYAIWFWLKPTPHTGLSARRHFFSASSFQINISQLINGNETSGIVSYSAAFGALYPSRLNDIDFYLKRRNRFFDILGTIKPSILEEIVYLEKENEVAKYDPYLIRLVAAQVRIGIKFKKLPKHIKEKVESEVEDTKSWERYDKLRGIDITTYTAKDTLSDLDELVKNKCISVEGYVIVEPENINLCINRDDSDILASSKTKGTDVKSEELKESESLTIDNIDKSNLSLNNPLLDEDTNQNLAREAKIPSNQNINNFDLETNEKSLKTDVIDKEIKTGLTEHPSNPNLRNTNINSNEDLGDMNASEPRSIVMNSEGSMKDSDIKDISLSSVPTIIDGESKEKLIDEEISNDALPAKTIETSKKLDESQEKSSRYEQSSKHNEDIPTIEIHDTSDNIIFPETDSYAKAINNEDVFEANNNIVNGNNDGYTKGRRLNTNNSTSFKSFSFETYKDLSLRDSVLERHENTRDFSLNSNHGRTLLTDTEKESSKEKENNTPEKAFEATNNTGVIFKAPESTAHKPVNVFEQEKVDPEPLKLRVDMRLWTQQIPRDLIHILPLAPLYVHTEDCTRWSTKFSEFPLTLGLGRSYCACRGLHEVFCKKYLTSCGQSSTFGVYDTKERYVWEENDSISMRGRAYSFNTFIDRIYGE